VATNQVTLHGWPDVAEMENVMKIVIDENELRPLVEQVVTQAVERLERDRARIGDRIALGEAEAATMLGVPRHVLRDMRLRGEVVAGKLGRRIVYSREQLLVLLERSRNGK
jgi:hypothetical protein